MLISLWQTPKWLLSLAGGPLYNYIDWIDPYKYLITHKPNGSTKGISSSHLHPIQGRKMEDNGRDGGNGSDLF